VEVESTLDDLHGCTREEPGRCGEGSKALRPSRWVSPPITNVITITEILIIFGRNGRSLSPECATSGPNRSAQLGIERLNGIRGVQNPPDLAGKGMERHDFGPSPAPALADGGVFLAPAAVLEGSRCGFADVSTDRPINLGFPPGSGGFAKEPRTLGGGDGRQTYPAAVHAGV
jgi:hypothetical protein